uniref:Uncharacterized protein n=1 Tax=Steinernema glaseri TaxID=37863 RepID=A0A1I7ZBI7_9BILA
MSRITSIAGLGRPPLVVMQIECDDSGLAAFIQFPKCKLDLRRVPGAQVSAPFGPPGTPPFHPSTGDFLSTEATLPLVNYIQSSCLTRAFL